MLSTRERLVASAGRLIMRRGVGATSTGDVLADAAAPRGSLYHHFPGGKAQLVEEALAATSDLVATAIERAPAVGTPGEQVIAFADAWAGSLQASGWRDGCPVTTAALELAADDEGVREVAAQAYARWRAGIAAALERAGRTAATAEAEAEFVLAAIEGALVLARVARDRGPVDRTAQRLAAMLDDERGAPSAS